MILVASHNQIIISLTALPVLCPNLVSVNTRKLPDTSSCNTKIRVVLSCWHFPSPVSPLQRSASSNAAATANQFCKLIIIIVITPLWLSIMISGTRTHRPFLLSWPSTGVLRSILTRWSPGTYPRGIPQSSSMSVHSHNCPKKRSKGTRSSREPKNHLLLSQSNE